MVQEHINFHGDHTQVQIFVKLPRWMLWLRKNSYNFPGGKTYHKNRSNFLRAFSRFCKNTYDFLRDHTPRTDILQNCLVGCFQM